MPDVEQRYRQVVESMLQASLQEAEMERSEEAERRVERPECPEHPTE